MTLIQMQYFVATARELNFTKAAAKLYISQQSLSASIAALEAELGCQLFIRKTPLQLTYAGEEFLKYANDILRRIETMKHDFKDIREDKKGILRIGIAPTRGRAILTDIIEAFHAQYPGIQIVITEDTNDGLQLDVQNGKIDIAIANLTGADDIVLRDFYKEEIVLFAADKLLEQCFPQNKAEAIIELRKGNFALLKACPFILGSPQDIASRISTQMLRSNTIEPKTVVHADNAELWLSLCLKGLGFCFCPNVLAKAVLSKKQLQSLHMFHLGDSGKYQIHFAHRREDHIWSVMQSFMEIAVATLHNA
jgi:DNA-binding transcriptional LysR family regulator